MVDGKHARAAVVGVSHERTRCLQTRGSEHRGGDFVRRAQRKADNRGTGATQETTERAGFFAGSDHASEERNELCSKWLVQVIAECPTEIFIAAARHCRGKRARIGARFHGQLPLDLVRQDFPRGDRLDFKGRDEEHEMEPPVDGEFLRRPSGARDRKSAEFGRRRIVRVAFQFRAEVKNLGPRQRGSGERIQGVEHAQAHGYAAAEAARLRHVAFDRAGERKGRESDGRETFLCRLRRHRAANLLVGAFDANIIVDSQRHPETIEAGAEIRSGGRDAHRDLLCFQ